MKNKAKLVSKIIISGYIAIVLLSSFSFIYDYNGAGVLDNTGATPSKRKPFQITTNMNEGFCFKRADANGYYNTENTTMKKPDVLIMGSSHIEAVQMQNEKSVGGILSKEFKTYNIGVSGNFLPSCVSHMENAVKTYNPQKFVVLETSTCHPDFKAMEKALLKCNNKGNIQVHGDIISYISTYMPAVPNLYYSLDKWYTSDTLLKETFKPYENNYDTDELLYSDTLNRLLQKAVLPIKDSSISLIIFYHSHIEIDQDGFVIEKTDKEKKDIERFRNICKLNDIIFIDMTPELERFYYKTKQLPYGFYNTAIGSGHLNEHGHKVIADRLAEVIRKDAE